MFRAGVWLDPIVAEPLPVMETTAVTVLESGDRFFTPRIHDAPNGFGAAVMVDRAEVFRVADKLRSLRGEKKVRVG